MVLFTFSCSVFVCCEVRRPVAFSKDGSTIGDAFDLLTSPLKWEKIAGSGSGGTTRLVIPIVRGTDDMRIIGEVKSGALMTLVDRFLGEDGAVAQARRLSSCRWFLGRYRR